MLDGLNRSRDDGDRSSSYALPGKREVLLRGLRVLIVEDVYLLASSLAAALEAAGAQVLGPFRMRSQAHEALSNSPADLALLDINVGGEPCYPLAEELAAQGVPFIFVTGYERQFLPHKWRSARVLTKPVDPAVVAEEALSLIARP